MKKAEPQVPFVPYRSDDRTPHERVLDLMDMAHAKTCCILKQLGRAWPRPADEDAVCQGYLRKTRFSAMKLSFFSQCKVKMEQFVYCLLNRYFFYTIVF